MIIIIIERYYGKSACLVDKKSEPCFYENLKYLTLEHET